MNKHDFNVISGMPPSYDIIIEEDGLLKTIEVWAVNKKGAISEWRGKKEKIRGIVFNDKNDKDD